MKTGRSGRAGWLVACLAAAAVGWADQAGAQPANDDCGDATRVADGTYSGSTVGATNDGAGTCGSSSSTPDVWYAYTAPFDGTLTVDTCGSGYDTVLGIWSACPGGGSEIACNDDMCGLQSTVLMAVSEGSLYHIRVSGVNGATGSFTLTIDTVDQGGGGTGPDVIYTDIGGIDHHGPLGGIHAYVLGSWTCNIGDQNLLWTNNGTPGLAMNAYRLFDGRLEQIGMSWVKTACCAAATSGCGVSCNGQGGNVLGAGCRDIYSAGWNGTQSRLGPRSGINPFSGAFSAIPGGSGDAIFRRLQIAEADLTQTGALYFVDGVYVGSDDAVAGNWLNNASYKRVTVSGSFTLSETGAMNETIPAIYAWQDHGNGVDTPDPSVEIVNADVPDEGRFIVAARVEDNGDGTWRYAYGVYNLNSDVSGGSFSVPIGAGTSVTNAGFNDVDYHSGEPYDNTDWPVQIDSTSVSWSSPETYDQNPDSNALRWGTMYTFWFDADAGPEGGTVTLGLFKPHAVNSVDSAVSVPSSGGTICTGNERMRFRCRPRANGNFNINVQITRAEPGEVLTVRRDGDPSTDKPMTIQDNGRGRVSFRNLPPGTYFFEALECDVDGTRACP